MIGKIMIDNWKEIEAVLDKYGVKDKDRKKALDAYKAVCWEWSESKADAMAFEEKIKYDYPAVWNVASKLEGTASNIVLYQRENWPDEWSVCQNSDYCEL